MAVGGKNFFVVLAAFALVLCLGGCGAYYKAAAIEDYALFLHNYAKYYALPDLPSIEGFTPVTDIGAVIDKYVICEENGRKGVRTALGKEILPCEYSRVQIAGNTILAENAEGVSVYTGKTLAGFAAAGQNVSLLSQNYLLWGDNVCDLSFNAQYACGRKYIGVPHENMVAVELASGYAGYADIAGNRLIGGEYIETGDFGEGVACAKKASGEYVVIDKSGNELYSSKDKKIGNRVNGYFVYLKQQVYGVLDENFNDITGAIFPFLRYEYATGDYIIPRYNSGYAIYSLKEGKFTGAEHEQIDYACGIFICRDGDKTTLRNAELKIIAECDYAEIAENVLTVRLNGKNYYYVRG